MDPKVLAQVLSQLPLPSDPNLIVGLDTSDDAAVYKITDDIAVIQTLDFFTPMVDDPYTFGQVAAANALSDIYAMGGRPILALNIAAFPAEMPPEIIGQILRGGSEKVREAEANIVGGHTITDAEPKYGLSVMGLVHPNRVWANAYAQPGDILYLTKALGTGILNTAFKADILTEELCLELSNTMIQLNKATSLIAQKIGINAATDITGFGFIGHALEMANASGVDLEFETSRIPILKGAREMAEMGLIPAGAYRNRNYNQDRCQGFNDLPLWLADILVDPQTSGGLLLAVPQDKAMQFESMLQEQSAPGTRIGRALAKGQGLLVFK